MRQKLLIAIHLSNTHKIRTNDQFLKQVSHQAFKFDVLLISQENHHKPVGFPETVFWIGLKKKVGEGRVEKLAYTYAIENNYKYVTIVDDTQGYFLIDHIDQFTQDLSINPDFLVLNDTKQSYFGVIKYFQKKILKMYINSFHSNVVIYATQFLRKIPFRFNSDDDNFKLEVRVQAFLSRPSFKEVHFDSVQRSFSFKKKWKSLTLLSKVFFHNLGIFYQKKFDLVINNEQYSLKLGYASSHTYAINGVNPNTKVADVGAGPFGIGHELKKRGCEIVTIDQFDIPDGYKCGDHIVADLNQYFNISLKEYDYILFLDIIEHLVNPEDFLFQISQQYTYRPQKLILTTGNIAFLPVRMMLFLGFFNYGKSGILDKTHTRLFTFSSFKKLIKDSQLKITKVRGVPAPYPKAIGNNLVAKFLLGMNLLLIKLSKGIFSYQIYIEAETTPSIQFMVSQIEAKNAQKGKLQ